MHLTENMKIEIFFWDSSSLLDAPEVNSVPAAVRPHLQAVLTDESTRRGKSRRLAAGCHFPASGPATGVRRVGSGEWDLSLRQAKGIADAKAPPYGLHEPKTIESRVHRSLDVSWTILANQKLVSGQSESDWPET